MVDTSLGSMAAQFTSGMTGNWGLGIIKGLIWSVWIILAIIIFYVAYIFLFYNIKATVFFVSGSGDKESPYTIWKKKFDRIKNNPDGSWTWLLRKWKKEEKFPDRHVYGNNVIAFKVGEKYFPGRVNFEGLDSFSVSPVPYDVRRKAELEIQEAQLDLQKLSWWEQGGKTFVMVVIGIVAVCGVAAFMLWLSFTKTGEITGSMDRLVTGLKTMGEIPAAR